MSQFAFFRFGAAVVLLATAAFGADLNREMILVPPDGVAPEDREIAAWQKRVGDAGARDADFDRLGWAFVAKARRTLDTGYYKLAEKTADVMDAQFGPSPEAALLRGHVFHNLHRFGEAETIARGLVKTRAMPEDWALLSDALMEQGNLAEAIDALQRFVNLKPGAEADARIAHLRWLKGDLPGAISAMEAAVRETSPRDDEHLAWMLSRLAGFWLQRGDLARARAVATSALRHVADFPPALLVMGRIQLALPDTVSAVASFEAAAKRNPLPEYLWWLAEAYRSDEQPKQAEAVERDIVERGDRDDPRTLAIFLATRRDRAAVALRLARAEMESRRDPLTRDALAWALFANGAPEEAANEMRAALADGTKDPRLLLHAAAIAQALGKGDEAQKFAAESKQGGAALFPSERVLLDGLFADGRQAAMPCGSPERLARRSSPTS